MPHSFTVPDATPIRRHAPRWRPWLFPLLAGAAAWLWFAVRDLSPWFDLLAAGLPAGVVIVAVLWVLVAAAFVNARWLVASLLTLTMGLTAVLLPLRPEATAAPDASLRIATANVASEDGSGVAQARALAAQDFDIVVVTELTWNFQRTLQGEYPHVEVRPRSQALAPWGILPPSIGIFSKFPLAAPETPENLPGIRLQVKGPGGPFALYGLHVPRPHPSDRIGGVTPAVHRDVVDAVVERVRGESLPVVVAGDLNATDRGGGYRAFRTVLDDAMRAEWAGGTSRLSVPLWEALVLRIDHILRPPTWCSATPERFPIRASDHLGVAVDIGPCP